MRKGEGFLDIRDAAFGAGHDRNAGLPSDLARLDLAAHEVDGLRGRSDKGDARRLAELGEFGVFRQEAVAGMNRVRADALGDLHDLLPVKEAFDGAGPYEVGLIGLLDVDAGGVRFGIDRRRRDVEFATPANDAHGDFATIGNENLPEHDGIERGAEP
ncbi:MAG: hypothetical protein UZ03_NOB001001370 [Nitrospira sp. OLB3]|nr:MAG: hypothetical protein UZ03_NOB001001370 [Nitrospira sp. OLB3]